MLNRKTSYTPIGIYNGNSHFNRSLREVAVSHSPNLITTAVPEIVTVRALIDKAQGSLEAAEMVAAGGLPKGNRLAAEYRAQLFLLSEYSYTI